MAYCRPFETFLKDVPRCPPAAEVASSLDKIVHNVRAARGGMVPLKAGGDMIVYIVSGATKLIASASAGREQIVSFHFSGDLVSVPADASHSYGLCALADAEALVFPAKEFLELTQSDAAFHGILLERSLTALHRCRDKAVALGRKSAEERLASFLVGMGERIGLSARGNCTLELPMSRRDIGDSLGLTIETISRQFGSLRKAGLIETSGRWVVVLCDPAQLALRAGHI